MDGFGGPPAVDVRRVRVRLEGVVREVGLRPFVRVLARRLGLVGWARRDGEALLVEVEGVLVERFIDELRRFSPPLARIDAMTVEPVATIGEVEFRADA